MRLPVLASVSSLVLTRPSLYLHNGSSRSFTRPRPRLTPLFVTNEKPNEEHISSQPTASLPVAAVPAESSTQVEELESIPISTAVFWLNLVAILWGTQHAVIKQAVDSSAAADLILLRFGLASCLASPYTPRNPQAWRWGAEMGLWMFLGFALQAIGLEYTTAQKSGFLLYLNVKFVPFLAKFLVGRDISLATWISAIAAFTGTALLAGTSELNIGDAWSIAAALASAMFILRLERASTQVPDAAVLNAASLWTVTALSTIWWTTTSGDWEQLATSASKNVGEILYLGAFTTAVANWVQTKYQKTIPAERASVIYAMDPVYGAIFAYLLLGEQLETASAWVGAGIITIAAATNAFLDFQASNDDDTTSQVKDK